MLKKDANGILGKLRFAKIGYLDENVYLNMKKNSIREYLRYRKHYNDERLLEKTLIVYYDYDSSNAFELLTESLLPVIDPEPYSDKALDESISAFYICDTKRKVSINDLEEYLKNKINIINAVKDTLEEAKLQKEKSTKHVDDSLESFIDELTRKIQQKKFRK